MNSFARFALMSTLSIVSLGCDGLERFRTAPEKIPVPLVRVASEQDECRLADTLTMRFELEAAHKILDGKGSAEARLSRARLAIYEADCERAVRELDSDGVRRLKGARDLAAFAERCARATAGAVIVSDEHTGIWLRIQDDADRALAPLLIKAFGSALPVLEKELGATLPRPLRIDVVRDLFSLSAVSGLPLESAETTGTVAIAKFARVTFLSPRAIPKGFPWEDTVAHEITHLVISKASHDRAPLWLQEGVAKRYETKYRKGRPFDGEPDPAVVAYQALVSGTSVGLDRLGPSIAMLSSGDAARIAFAEVSSFIEFFLERNGKDALRALFLDMRTAESDVEALRSVSGYSLVEWQLLYRKWLSERFASAEFPDPDEGLLDGLDHYRGQRTVELLDLSEHPRAAADWGAPLLEKGGRDPEFRFLVGRAAAAAKRTDARALIGDLDQVRGPNAGHLILLSRRGEFPEFSAEKGDPASISGGHGFLPEPEELRAQAKALDPLLLEVACAGSRENSDDVLCSHVRTLPRRGTE